MARVRVDGFTISLDGFGAGPDQDIDHPLGIGGTELHGWLRGTRTFQRTVLRADGGTTGIDDRYAARGFENVGAWILGRNMFGPIRGPWPDDAWKGWWGDEPPYHVPVFVLTHHRRAPLEMAGGTTFHFVTGGIGEALDRALAAAGDRDDPPVSPGRPCRRAARRDRTGPAGARRAAVRRTRHAGPRLPLCPARVDRAGRTRRAAA